MDEIKVGDLVRVVSGPAYVKNGRVIKGKVEEVFGDVALVRVATGGLWGFNTFNLKASAKNGA